MASGTSAVDHDAPDSAAVFGWPSPSNELHLDPRHARRPPQRRRGQRQQELRDPDHGSVSVSAAAIALSTALALFAASVYS